MNAHWKRLARETVFHSKFLTVYNDTVQLPNGSVIDDYTVVKKLSFVMIVATDTEGRLIILREYKYAVDKVMLALSAGCIEANESVLEAAKRELEEETGATGGTFEEIGVIYEYPTKDMHAGYIVRAKGVTITEQPRHEATESITVQTISIELLKQQILNKEWESSSAIAALTLSGVFF